MTIRILPSAAVALVLGLAGPTFAQSTAPTPGTATPATPAPGVAAPAPTATAPTSTATPAPANSNNGAVNTSAANNAAAPVPGANSYTEGQAKARLEEKGFSEVTELKLDGQGIWRAKAMQSGKSVEVALDFQGNVFTN